MQTFLACNVRAEGGNVRAEEALKCCRKDPLLPGPCWSHATGCHQVRLKESALAPRRAALEPLPVAGSFPGAPSPPVLPTRSTPGLDVLTILHKSGQRPARPGGVKASTGVCLCPGGLLVQGHAWVAGNDLTTSE